MSEEISEEELTEKIITICGELEDIGEKALSQKLFKKIEKKLEFVSLPDWTQHQICDTYPECDLRTLVYCCAPTNPCPYRASVLRKLKWSLKDYIKMKKKFAVVLEASMMGFEEC